MTTETSILDSNSALVLIDLQAGICARDTAPHAAGDVVARSATLAKAFRARGLPVILVTVGWAADMADAPRQRHAAVIPSPADTAAFVAIVPELEAEASDIEVRKHQWGAFHGTDLDLQLRRRGVTQIVLGGIATNMGVESTARAAWEHGYSIVFAEDATSSFSDAMHAFAFETIFPRLGLVSDTAAIIASLS
ncbi:MAG TPA: hydrolase [Sphingobium sp.]